MFWNLLFFYQSLLRRCVGYNSEDVMFLEDNRVSKTTSVQGYESDWLGRWTQPGNEVNYHDQSYNGDSNDLIRPEEKIPDEAVLPFPMFKFSQKRDGTKSNVGSRLKAVVANRMPWMNAHGDKKKLSS